MSRQSERLHGDLRRFPTEIQASSGYGAGDTAEALRDDVGLPKSPVLLRRLASLHAEVARTYAALAAAMEDAARPEPVEDRWLNQREAAAYLGMKLSRLNRLSARRLVPVVKQGQQNYYQRSALDRWMVEQGGQW